MAGGFSPIDDTLFQRRRVARTVAPLLSSWDVAWSSGDAEIQHALQQAVRDWTTGENPLATLWLSCVSISIVPVSGMMPSPRPLPINI